jgi:hypothetical protein
MNNSQIKTELQNELIKNQHIYTYDDSSTIQLISDLIFKGTTIGISKYLQEHVMYFFIITLHGCQLVDKFLLWDILTIFKSYDLKIVPAIKVFFYKF